MRTAYWIAIAVAAMAPIAWIVGTSMETAGTKVEKMLSSHGLDETAQKVRVADEKLNAMVQQELGTRQDGDREIDFANPTDDDVRFLVGLVRDGTPEQKSSAGRALVQIGDPRFVRTLVEATSEGQDGSFFCLAGQEILRHQTRPGAAEWLLDLLEDPALKMSPACREELTTRLDGLDPASGEVVTELLFSERPRVQRWAIAHLPPAEATAAERERVTVLATSSDVAVRKDASAWLQTPASRAPTPAPEGVKTP